MRDNRKHNQILAINGISGTMSPLFVVNGDGPPDINKMKVEFSEYVKVF